MRRSVRRTFNVPAEMVQGIIAGGEAALARATEATEDDPAIGVRDLLARGFSAGTCWWGSRRAAALLMCWARSRRRGGSAR